MGNWLRAGFAVLLFIQGGCDCSPKPPAPPPPPAAATIFDVTGTLHRVDAELGKAVIEHSAIPGYMEAMTMEFRAAQPGDLAGFQRGDVLAFRLTVTDTRSSISQIRKTGRTELPPETPRAPETSTAQNAPAPGDLLPDIALTNDQGRPVRLADFRGRALAITFIFTRCPLPDFCPLMSRNFSAVEGELAGAKADWHLLSVTIDPAHDTPEKLAAYAKAYRTEAAQWTFATGDAQEVLKLGTAVGLATHGEGLALEHNLRTLVLDRAGKIQKVFTGNDWQVRDLVAELKRAMTEGAPR